MEDQLTDWFAQKDRVLDLLLPTARAAAQACTCVKTWKEEFALVAESPTFVYVPEKVQVTQFPPRSHCCPLALTAPNSLTSPLSKVGTSTRLECCTSLHPLSSCLYEFLLLGLLLPASTVPGLSCETLAGKGQNWGFLFPTSIHPKSQ